MIVPAPQLNDWGEISAAQTIALVGYFLGNYKINPSKIYINGYLGGWGNIILIPVKKGIPIKGAVLICAGGAFEFRSNEAEALQEVSIPTEVNVLQDMPYGYGSTGGWKTMTDG